MTHMVFSLLQEDEASIKAVEGAKEARAQCTLAMHLVALAQRTLAIGMQGGLGST